jgi:hypothetical protein
MPGWRQRKAVGAAFALVLLLTFFLSWQLTYAGDESSHLTMIRHHAHHLDLATWKEFQYGADRGHSYFLFSPAPYLVYVPFELLDEHMGALPGSGHPDRFVTRLGGLLIAAAQLAVSIAFVRRLCRSCDELTVVAIALAANLLPQLRYIHSYPNTDGVTILVATACFWCALRILQLERIGLRDAVLVGALLGAMAHVRFQAFIAGGILLAALAWRVVRQRDALRPKLRMLGVAVALPVLIAGSFHLAIYHELDNGHILPTVDNEQLNDSTYEGKILPRPPAKTLVKHRVKQIPGIWMGMWAWYVSLVSLRGGWLLLLALMTGLGVVGLLVSPSGLLDRRGRLLGVLAVVGTCVVWISMAAQWLVGQQGKFMLPLAFPALLAIVAGTGALLARSTRLQRPMLIGAAAWGALLLGIDIWAAAHVAVS